MAVVCEESDDLELYIDIVRKVIVNCARFTYVDIYVDVLHRVRRTWSKDDDLAATLAPEEGRQVLDTRDALLRAVCAGDPSASAIRSGKCPAPPVRSRRGMS